MYVDHAASPSVYPLLEACPLGMMLVEDDGTLSFVNALALDWFGYDADELLGRQINTLLPGFDPESPGELVARRKDGTTLTLAVSLSPLVHEGRRRSVCALVDLTPGRTAEKDLTRFFDLSLDLFCIANMGGYFVRLNPNFSRVLGYPDDVLLTRPFLEFVHADDVVPTQAVMGTLAAGEPLVRFRNRYRRSAGDYRWFEWSARPIPGEGTIFATARDITEQVELEAQLVARERRERAILDNTPAVVYVKNRDGRYEYVNQRHAELFAVDAEHVVGQREHDVFPADVADAFEANDRMVFESGQKLTLQELVPQPDGVHTYVSTKFPLFNARGEVEAVAGISTDITAQVRARETEEQLRLARAFQRKLYPDRPPTVAGLDAAGSAVPVAQVCGDYYDFLPRGPGQLVVGMGDVSGHGIGPALEMVAVRTAMRMLLRGDGELMPAIDELNRKLCDDLPESSFVSLFLAELDATGRRLRYIGAGHEALLVRAGGGAERLMSTGWLLGIDREAVFEEKSVEVGPGDLFLLCTDGLTETMDRTGEQFGTPRLIEAASGHATSSAEDVIGAIFRAVYEYANGKAIADDMTLVVVRFLARTG